MEPDLANKITATKFTRHGLTPEDVAAIVDAYVQEVTLCSHCGGTREVPETDTQYPVPCGWCFAMNVDRQRTSFKGVQRTTGIDPTTAQWICFRGSSMADCLPLTEPGSDGDASVRHKECGYHYIHKVARSPHPPVE